MKEAVESTRTLKPAERLEKALKKFGILDYENGQEIKGLWLPISDWERFISEVKSLEASAPSTPSEDALRRVKAKISALNDGATSEKEKWLELGAESEAKYHAGRQTGYSVALDLIDAELSKAAPTTIAETKDRENETK